MALDLTKPVQTRDGRKVRILDRNVNNPDFPVVGLLVQFDGRECIHSWTRDGDSFRRGPTQSDLVNVPVKREGWVNLYRETGCYAHYQTVRPGHGTHPSKTAAVASVRPHDEPGCGDYVATVKIEWEE